MFRRFYEWPMRQVLEAYQPVTKGESGSSTWREAILQMGGEHLRPIMQCDGHYTHGCEYLVDDIDFKAEQHNQEEAQAPALEEPINV